MVFNQDYHNSIRGQQNMGYLIEILKNWKIIIYYSKFYKLQDIIVD